MARLQDQGKKQVHFFENDSGVAGFSSPFAL
jgi:hypothetical protein